MGLERPGPGTCSFLGPRDSNSPPHPVLIPATRPPRPFPSSPGLSLGLRGACTGLPGSGTGMRGGCTSGTLSHVPHPPAGRTGSVQGTHWAAEKGFVHQRPRHPPEGPASATPASWGAWPWRAGDGLTGARAGVGVPERAPRPRAAPPGDLSPHLRLQPCPRARGLLQGRARQPWAAGTSSFVGTGRACSTSTWDGGASPRGPASTGI